MKIILNIPDRIKVMTVAGVYLTPRGGLEMAHDIFNTEILKDGAEINCDWNEVAE